MISNIISYIFVSHGWNAVIVYGSHGWNAVWIASFLRIYVIANSQSQAPKFHCDPQAMAKNPLKRIFHNSEALGYNVHPKLIYRSFLVFFENRICRILCQVQRSCHIVEKVKQGVRRSEMQPWLCVSLLAVFVIPE